VDDEGLGVIGGLGSPIPAALVGDDQVLQPQERVGVQPVLAAISRHVAAKSRWPISEPAAV